MLGITGVCCRLVGELAQALGSGGWRRSPSSSSTYTTTTCIDQPSHEYEYDAANYSKHGSSCKSRDNDELMIRALRAVFGMGNNGRIKKKNARRVVEKLSLDLGLGLSLSLSLVINSSSSGADEDGEEEDDVAAEEVLCGIVGEGCARRQQLLEEAFKIFDEDGNGYIEAAELKRVLQCLGLDKGWDMSQIQAILMAADLNLDGKVDFTEFQFMMASPPSPPKTFN